MSDIIIPKVVDTEVTTVTTETITNPEVKMVNSDSSNLEISKLSKDYKFWARFNQILVIIGGVFSLPVGALAIIGAVKFNKSIEIVDETSKETKTQEFVESVKEFQKWSVISVFGAWVFGIVIGLAFGALIFGTIMTSIDAEKRNPMRNQNLNSSYGSQKSEFSSIANSVAPNTNLSTTKQFNISTDEGSMVIDADGNMKVIDKDGKVTTVNMDGTMGTEK
jgi:hypothetical protein